MHKTFENCIKLQKLKIHGKLDFVESCIFHIKSLYSRISYSRETVSYVGPKILLTLQMSEQGLCPHTPLAVISNTSQSLALVLTNTREPKQAVQLSIIRYCQQWRGGEFGFYVGFCAQFNMPTKC